MEPAIISIAQLAYIDRILFEYQEDMGDLPKIIHQKEILVHDASKKVKETEKIINDINLFVSTSKETLISLKDKEDKLTQQQFLVRNNKEFDAISSQISTLKSQHAQLSIKLRTEGTKLENLKALLEEQTKTVSNLEEELVELNEEYKEVIKSQGDEFERYNKIREILKERMDPEIYANYARIQHHVPDAAVGISKDSCMGCYRAIPKQIIVEMRNQKERIFVCENCGRILIPDWVEVNEEELEKLI
ncbi:MAG: hypothetical protein IKH10_03000 [Bacteroidetes bacterium]|nr:hypothetical protein [Bacteroidota bacterium]